MAHACRIVGVAAPIRSFLEMKIMRERSFLCSRGQQRPASLENDRSGWASIELRQLDNDPLRRGACRRVRCQHGSRGQSLRQVLGQHAPYHFVQRSRPPVLLADVQSIGSCFAHHLATVERRRNVHGRDLHGRSCSAVGWTVRLDRIEGVEVRRRAGATSGRRQNDRESKSRTSNASAIKHPFKGHKKHHPAPRRHSSSGVVSPPQTQPFGHTFRLSRRSPHSRPHAADTRRRRLDSPRTRITSSREGAKRRLDPRGVAFPKFPQVLHPVLR